MPFERHRTAARARPRNEWHARSFDLLLPHLVEKFTLIAIDRRGCGTSGDAPGPYSIEREFEDVAAVVNSVGERVSLFGHSYGALVALGAAPLARNLAKLVLYEPPLRVRNVSDLFLERLDDLARRGDLETLLTEFYNVDWMGLTPEQLNAGRMRPDWGSRVAARGDDPPRTASRARVEPEHKGLSGIHDAYAPASRKREPRVGEAGYGERDRAYQRQPRGHPTRSGPHSDGDRS